MIILDFSVLFFACFRMREKGKRRRRKWPVKGGSLLTYSLFTLRSFEHSGCNRTFHLTNFYNINTKLCVNIFLPNNVCDLNSYSCHGILSRNCGNFDRRDNYLS